MKLKKWEIALAVSFIIALLCGFSAERQHRELSEKLIRLHVVANSDSEEDQALKLRARDAVMSELEQILDGCSDARTASELISKSLPKLEKTVGRIISQGGYDYTVSAKLGEESFPTCEYDGFSLPAGNYSSLRIVIGEGRGHNWWCVVFPPLCISAAESGTFEEASLSDDEIALITEDGAKYIIRFKTLELWSALKELFK